MITYDMVMHGGCGCRGERRAVYVSGLTDFHERRGVGLTDS